MGCEELSLTVLSFLEEEELGFSFLLGWDDCGEFEGIPLSQGEYYWQSLAQFRTTESNATKQYWAVLGSEIVSERVQDAGVYLPKGAEAKRGHLVTLILLSFFSPCSLLRISTTDLALVDVIDE